MELMLSILVGILFGTAFYTMLRRSIVRLAIGLTLLSHAANLVIFTVSGVSREGPPIVEGDQVRPAILAADPVPQALVLTAIVISFAMTALFLVVLLAARGFSGTDHVDGREGEREAEH